MKCLLMRNCSWFLLLLLLENPVYVHSLSKTSKRPRIPILEYHDNWVCVNKPSGITVHRGKGTPKHTAVLTTTVKRQLARKVFPVHRLDHRTSGAMIFAFNSDTAGELHTAAIRNGKKKYVALVRGEWTHTEPFLVVDKPLDVKGIQKDASTRFSLLGSTKGVASDDRCSLLLCEPLTGRTHQIRRHAYAMGMPIIGDTQHGDNSFNRWWRTKRKLSRLALHCLSIEFEWDQHYECVAPLSHNLKAVLE